MSNSESCKCCENESFLTPVPLDNPPGQSTLAYRVGTQARFKAAMQAAISSQSALNNLTTRNEDDPSMALIDAWATTLDVLTFYQERIANEGYLRTATERRSILELARSIGYELRPGVAASTYLAFELDDVPGAPEKAIKQMLIDIGTKVQSVPGPEEKPQTFETIEKIEARLEWNTLKPKTTESIVPGFGTTTIFLKGTATNLRVGDALLFVGVEREHDPGNKQWDFRRVKTIMTDDKADYTVVTLDRALGTATSFVAPSANPNIYALRLRSNLFGYNAPDWRTMSDSIKTSYLLPGGLSAEYFDDANLTNRKLTRLDPVVNFNWGAGSPDPAIASNTFSARWTGFVKPKASGTYTFYTRSDDGVRLWVNGKLIIANWTNHAPTDDNATITLAAEKVYSIVLEYYENGGSAMIELAWSGPDFLKETIPSHRLYPMPPDEWPGFRQSSLGSRQGLYAEYFDDADLTNRKLTRLDPVVNFNWVAGSPDPAVASDTFSARWTGFVKPEISGIYTFYTYSDDGVRLWVNGQLIINNWTDHGPMTDSATITLTAGQVQDIRLEYYENGGGAIIQLSWAAPGQTKPAVVSQNYLAPPDLYLDTIYPQISKDSWLVLSLPEYEELYQAEMIAEEARANFTLTAKTSRITVKGENLRQFDQRLRETVVFAQSEKLELTEQPITMPVSGAEVLLNQRVKGLYANQHLAVVGKDNTTNQPISEIATLKETQLIGDFTKLVFTANLQNTYRRDNVTINANVARAAHGETVHDVLGNGDASQAFQKFTLKQPPLTYIASNQSPSGALSTLAVRVNDVLWQEKPSLYGLDSHSHSYTTRMDDDGKVIVEFGDGQLGARPPSGIANIRATYRAGTGLAGLVKANQISLLMTRPLGIKGMINPTAPEGAQDPETRDQARQNAPLTVLTLDRVVSLQDFEDFTRAFSGIGKAQAVWLWDGEHRIVHISVASANGAPIPENSDLRTNLSDAITAACDPAQAFLVDSYTSLTFKLVAKVKIDPAYLTEKVTAAIKEPVTEAFSFAQREFGQGVTASEIIMHIQRVEGVVYVDLDSLVCVEKPGAKPPLLARMAHREGKVIEPAELLTLSDQPGSFELIVI